MQLSCASNPWNLGRSTPHHPPTLPMPDLGPPFPCYKATLCFTTIHMMACSPHFSFGVGQVTRVSKDKDGEVAVAGTCSLRGLWSIPAVASCQLPDITGCD